MIILLLITILACGVLSYLVYEYTENKNRANCGNTGFRLPNTGKQFIDEIPLIDEQGNEFKNLWILDVGRYTGYRCISQWKLSKLMEDEKLNLVLEPDKSISIKNSRDEKIGYYPSEGINYQELQLRPEQKQKVIATVRNWGLEQSNAFCCGIAVYVYGEAPVV